MSEIDNAIKSLQDFLNLKSLGPLLLFLALAFIAGRIISLGLKALGRWTRKRADASASLGTVNMLQHAETWLILSIAIVQVILFILAFYFWWEVTYDEGSKSGLLLGAGAIGAILIGNVTRPVLTDLAFGASMMAERWYRVGDLVTIDFPNVKGVVEAVTLRSTRIKGINGQTYWVTNSAIQAVSVAQRGVLWIAIELFVNDIVKAKKLIADTNNLLPTGSTLVAEKLTISNIDQRAEKVWHISTVAAVPPGREWAIEIAAVDILKKLDENDKKPILLAEPVHHYDDHDAEKQLVRAVKNARKPYKKFSHTRLGRTRASNKGK